MVDRWLSVAEIAQYLGVSKDTVYAWLSSKNMPGYKVGRLWKFKAVEVDNWIQSSSLAAKNNRNSVSN